MSAQDEPGESDEGTGTLERGLSESEGDPRVHLLMNLLLSATFVYILLWGLDFLGTLEFTPLNLILGTIILMVLTHTLI